MFKYLNIKMLTRNPEGGIVQVHPKQATRTDSKKMEDRTKERSPSSDVVSLKYIAVESPIHITKCLGHSAPESPKSTTVPPIKAPC
jgi:hypothetical protein